MHGLHFAFMLMRRLRLPVVATSVDWRVAGVRQSTQNKSAQGQVCFVPLNTHTCVLSFKCKSSESVWLRQCLTSGQLCMRYPPAKTFWMESERQRRCRHTTWWRIMNSNLLRWRKFRVFSCCFRFPRLSLSSVAAYVSRSSIIWTL